MSTLRDALGSLPRAAAADLLERDDAYLLVVDIPGATADTTDLRVTDGRIHVEARREKGVPSDYRYRREQRPLFIDVDLPLPPDATSEGASATIEAGVLEIELPKRAEATATSIPIEVD